MIAAYSHQNELRFNQRNARSEPGISLLREFASCVAGAPAPASGWVGAGVVMLLNSRGAVPMILLLACWWFYYLLLMQNL